MKELSINLGEKVIFQYEHWEEFSIFFVAQAAEMLLGENTSIVKFVYFLELMVSRAIFPGVTANGKRVNSIDIAEFFEPTALDLEYFIGICIRYRDEITCKVAREDLLSFISSLKQYQNNKM